MSTTQNISFERTDAEYIMEEVVACSFSGLHVISPSTGFFFLSPFKNHLWGFIMALVSLVVVLPFKPTTKKTFCITTFICVQFRSVCKYFFYSLLLKIFSIMFKHHNFIVRIRNCSISRALNSPSFDLSPFVFHSVNRTQCLNSPQRQGNATSPT